MHQAETDLRMVLSTHADYQEAYRQEVAAQNSLSMMQMNDPQGVY